MPSRRELANAIRALSMDAVQKARSGHPGAPLGMADMAEALMNGPFVHNPANPAWPGRDRLVFSNGHGSMLVYALLHLTGYDLSIDDLKNFRQLHSKTPGHPELGVTPGVEATSGPLGQGIAAAVGMALAEKLLAAEFNRDGFDVIDHRTWVFLGDGCMMEGISHEACSLAGTLGLGKLTALYDDNRITIDGATDGWFTDDTPARFRSYGWHVVEDVDGHDGEAVKKALDEAAAHPDKPSLICCRTVIGFGAPGVCGTSGCHGSPLGDEEIAAARKELNWPHAPFEIPEKIRAGWDARGSGAKAEAAWNDLFAAYAEAHPETAAELTRRLAGELPASFAADADTFISRVAEAGENLASRKASGKALEGFGPLLPEMIGGSADLTGSNLTKWSGSVPVTPQDVRGNYVFYGVREFAMAAMMNGMALHGGFLPYAGTFLVFSDYMRNAMRMSALMGLRVVYVLTHDSIGVGEDGPTHQPVEHTASLRLIPNMRVWRPCDAVETAVAWRSAIETSDSPTSLVLSRQTLPHQERDAATVADIARGGYILKEAENPEAILLATGSEVGLAMEAADLLAAEGRRVRVVSLPCLEAFEAQDASYREAVLPPAITRRVAVEAGSTTLWHKYVGLEGTVVGMDRFGESAPGGQLFEYFGFTPDKVAQALEALF